MNFEQNKTGIIFDIKKFAVHDGPGIRTTVFFKGCPLRCLWCHNPESQIIEPQTFNEGLKYKYFNLSDEKKHLIGIEVSVSQVIKEIERDRIFYDESNGGVTFSGGEPLMQYEFLLELLKECKSKGFHTCVDTSGYAQVEVFEKINNFVDLYLYDIKIIDDVEHIKYTGVSNKIILDNLKYLSKEKNNLKIRIPIIPDITDTEKNIQGIIQYLDELGNVYLIDLLPYNKLVEEKCRRFNLNYKLEIKNNGLKNKIELIKTKFEQHDYKVSIGG